MQVTPRKTPRQRRAKVTVDAIVEATTQVLLEQGYDKFTTARAAERAGVSVGSLYQYFPNKAALASAVVDKCCQNFIVAFENAVGDRATLADCIGAVVDFSLVSYHITPDLHRVVHQLAPLLGVADRTQMVSRAAAKAIESMLRKHAAEIDPEIDLSAAATIIETMLEALAHNVVLAQPKQAPDDTFVKEANRLLTRYLAAGNGQS